MNVSFLNKTLKIKSAFSDGYLSDGYKIAAVLPAIATRTAAIFKFILLWLL